jgi:hypothetical protein
LQNNTIAISFGTSNEKRYKIENSANFKEWKLYKTVIGSGKKQDIVLENENKNQFFRIIIMK